MVRVHGQRTTPTHMPTAILVSGLQVKYVLSTHITLRCGLLIVPSREAYVSPASVRVFPAIGQCYRYPLSATSTNDSD